MNHPRRALAASGLRRLSAHARGAGNARLRVSTHRTAGHAWCPLRGDLGLLLHLDLLHVRPDVRECLLGVGRVLALAILQDGLVRCDVLRIVIHLVGWHLEPGEQQAV